MNKSKHVQSGSGVSNQAAPEWTGDKTKPATQPPSDEARAEDDRKLRQDMHRPFKGVGSL